MPTYLYERVGDELLPALRGLDVTMVGHSGGRWSNETVDLACQDARLRVLKDRGAFEVLFGSAVDPDEWYNSEEVLRLLDYRVQDLTSLDAKVMAQELAAFLRTNLPRVAVLFSASEYARNKQQLLQIRRMLNETLSPGRHAH